MENGAVMLIEDCLDELATSKRFEPYVQKADAAGCTQVAKLFRAMVASETAREKLFRAGMPKHAQETGDFFVCPHCGLIFYQEQPDQCPVDETPCGEFIPIS